MATDILCLAVGSLKFLKHGEKLRLLDNLRDEKDFLDLSVSEIEMIIKRALKCRNFSAENTMTYALETGSILKERGIGFLKSGGQFYPPLLGEIYDPPFILFYRGEISCLEKPAIAVVGTRKATGMGLEKAFRLGFDLGLNSLSVVSGLALGIDSSAHRGNIEGGSSTVAVSGCGIDRIYPPSNRGLGSQILETGGIILSEYYPGVPPLAYNFPERNRIISGLSLCVVIVEAPARSGALITADYALDQGRELYVHSCGLSGPASEGTKALAEDGAGVIDSAYDLWPGGPETGFPSAGSRRIGNGSGEQFLPGLEPVLSAGQAMAQTMFEELSGSLVVHRGLKFRKEEMA